MQSITSSAKRKCPECKEMKLKRLIGSGSGVIFKGDGFYCNDYKDSKKSVKKMPALNNKQWKKGPAKKANE
jgi:predicted nucleic acid-binding Zn ribbon protein